MTDDILLIDTDERVRTLTLNRPQSRNALSAALRDRFFAALADAEADDDIDVVILTGADPVFCAGLDLKELAGQTALPDISPRWPAMTKPVIGAINGAAVTVEPVGAHRLGGPDVQILDGVQTLWPVNRQCGNNFRCGPQ